MLCLVNISMVHSSHGKSFMVNVRLTKLIYTYISVKIMCFSSVYKINATLGRTVKNDLAVYAVCVNTTFWKR